MFYAMKLILLAFVCLLNISCSINILGSFGDATTDEALYEEAVQLINRGSYSEALSKIAEMGTSFQATREIVNLKASAHGGLCGLNFLSFIQALQNIGATRLFPFLLNLYNPSGTITAINNCILAETTLESIGTIAQRNTDENLFLAIIAFVKMGNIMALYADSDNNGTADGAYDANVCTKGGVARTAGSPIADSDASQFTTSVARVYLNLTAVAGEISVIGDSLADFATVCTALAGAPYNNTTYCANTDSSAVTDADRAISRSLIRESDSIGLGTCTGDLTTCNCPP